MRPERETARAPTNAVVAEHFESVAALLEEQWANQYRVQAWREGAATIRALAVPLAEILRHEGVEGLDRLPGIGPSLARAARELVETGRLGTLERLRSHRDPVANLASVPGVGHVLARRIRQTLGIDSLEALEAAAHNGSLAHVPGFGNKRLAGVRDALATRLTARRRRYADAASAWPHTDALPGDHGGSPARPAENVPSDDLRPAIAELLDVDRQYRTESEAGALQTIVPRRFNPRHARWLPVLHTVRGERAYTALFSNTSRAHQLGRTRDWVVLYFDGRDGERQCTIVTATSGVLRGRRVVRGRERECEAHYAKGRDPRSMSPMRRSHHAGETAAVRG